MPVAWDLIDSTAVIRAAGARIRGIHVDAVMSGQNDWPVIIIELSREEECAGKPVILCAVVSVVLVRRNCVASKTTVQRYVSGKPVVVTENNRLAVAANRQLWRNGSVKSPD